MANETVPFISSVGMSDDTGRSRGFSSGSAAATLFEGLTKTVAEVIPAADRSVKHNIQEEIRGGVSQIYEDFVGVNRETSSNGDVPASRTIPKDAKRDMNSIGRLRRKWESGKISSTHLHTAAAAIAKKVKTRYPGYSGEVDAALRGHGFNPANDILREHQAAQRAAQSSKAGTTSAIFKSNLRTLDWVMKKGLLSADDRALVLANPSVAAQNEELMGRIRVASSNEMAKDYKLEQASKLLSVQSSQNKINKDLAKSTLSQQVFGKIFDGVRSSGVQERFETAKREILARTKEGVAPSAEQNNELRAAWGAFKASVVESKNNIYASSSWATKTPEAMKDVNSLVDSYMNTTEKALFSGDTNMLEASTAWLNNLTTQGQVDLSKEFKSFSTIAAVNKSLGPKMTEWMVSQNPAALNMTQRYLSDKIKVDIAKGNVTSVVESLNAAKNAGTLDGPTADNVLATVKGVFSQTDTDPETVRKFYKAMFGEDNKRLLTSLEPAKRQEMYDFMVSPRTQKTLKAYVANGTLKQSELNGYASYVARSYLIASKDDIEEAQRVGQTDRNYYIQFDDEKSKYIVSTRRNVRPARTIVGALQEKGATGLTLGDITGSVVDAAQTNSLSTVQGLVDRLNGRIEPLTGIMTDTGTDPARILPSLVGVPLTSQAGVLQNGRSDLGSGEQANIPRIVRTIEFGIGTGTTSKEQRAAFEKFKSNPESITSEEVDLLSVVIADTQRSEIGAIADEVEELQSLLKDTKSKAGKRAIEREIELLKQEQPANDEVEDYQASLSKARQLLVNYINGDPSEASNVLPAGFESTLRGTLD